MSMIIDGMDQNKTRVPRPFRVTSDMANMHQITQAVIGAMVHGNTNRKFAYTFPSNYPKDASLSVQVLLNVLRQVKEQDGFLPPVLYLQLDNCWRENKNRTMFATCAALVQTGIFRKVCLLFSFASLC